VAVAGGGGPDRFSWEDLASRPALFPAVSLAVGTWFGLDQRPAIGFACSALFLLASTLWPRRTGAHLSLLVGMTAAGAGLSGLQSMHRVPPALADGGTARLEGTVEDVVPLEGTTRIELAVARTPDRPLADARFRVSLYASGPMGELEPGQRVQLAARLKPDEPPSNPGQSDTSEYRRRRALLFTGSFDPRRLVVLTEAAAWRRWLTRVRTHLAERVKEISPTPEAASLYLTMAAGLRSELGDEWENQFAQSGLAHVLSVSGLHVAALAVLTLRLMRRLVVVVFRRSSRFDARRIAAPMSIPLLWAYVVFTGNQTPAVRSAVMATAALLGMALWRRADVLNNLAWAAIALLVLDPSGIADLSLQLSFLAVASLVLLSPAIRGAIPIRAPDPATPGRLRFLLQKARESALQTFCASAAVTLAGSPLIAAAFHRISLAGLLSNIVSLPLCGLLTVLAAGGAAVFVVSPALAWPLLFTGSWAAQLLLWIVRFFAAAPGAAIPVASMGTAPSALFLIGLFAFSVFHGRRRFAALLAPLGLIAGLFGQWPWAQPGLTCTFLSVGHGDAVVVSSRGKHALIDGGGVPNGADTGRKYVLPFLRQIGVGQLELAVLSHPHPDHALGLASALTVVTTRRLWLPAGETRGELSERVIAAARGAHVEEVQAGRAAFPLGEAWIEVLGPPVDRVLLKKVNDRSVVLRVRHGEVTLLLTGDIEEDGEEFLEPGPTTIVKAPHHGSRTSSTAKFVNDVRPRFVVFCVGRGNRFHFPSEEVERRYRDIGSECFRTDLDGAVTFQSDGHGVRWQTFHPHLVRAAN